MENFDNSIPIVLLKEFSGSKYGDIINVAPGLYHTLIDRKIGMPIEYNKEIKDKENLIQNVADLTKENNDLWEKNEELYEENRELKERNEILEKCKDRRTIKK